MTLTMAMKMTGMYPYPIDWMDLPTSQMEYLKMFNVDVKRDARQTDAHVTRPTCSAQAFANGQRNIFLASALRIYGNKWSESSGVIKLWYILNGIQDLSFDDNCNFFKVIQNYILNTSLLSKS